MKEFFKNYIAIPLGILLLVFLAPTVAIGGVTLAFHLAGYLPETGICKKVEK